MTPKNVEALTLAGVLQALPDGTHKLTAAGAALMAYWQRSAQKPADFTPTAANRPSWAYGGDDWRGGDDDDPDGGCRTLNLAIPHLRVCG